MCLVLPSIDVFAQRCIASKKRSRFSFYVPLQNVETKEKFGHWVLRKKREQKVYRCMAAMRNCFCPPTRSRARVPTLKSPANILKLSAQKMRLFCSLQTVWICVVKKRHLRITKAKNFVWLGICEIIFCVESFMSRGVSRAVEVCKESSTRAYFFLQ